MPVSHQQLRDPHPVASSRTQTAVRTRSARLVVARELCIGRADGLPQPLGNITRIAVVRGELDDAGQQLHVANLRNPVLARSADEPVSHA